MNFISHSRFPFPWLLRLLNKGSALERPWLWGLVHRYSPSGLNDSCPAVQVQMPRQGGDGVFCLRQEQLQTPPIPNKHAI